MEKRKERTKESRIKLVLDSLDTIQDELKKHPKILEINEYKILSPDRRNDYVFSKYQGRNIYVRVI